MLEKNQTLNDLVEQSVMIGEVRYITFGFLLAVKKSWLQDDNVRQKDIDDVKLIEEHLAEQEAIPDATNADFTEVVRGLISTPPISNEEIIKRSKRR